MGTFFEHHARDFYSQRFDGPCGRLARLLSERACELTHAEMRGCGEFFHGELRTKILPRVRECGLNSIRLRRQREQRWVLPLSTAAAATRHALVCAWPRGAGTQLSLPERPD